MKKGLGRGLDALLADNTSESPGGITVLRLSDIEPNIKQVRKDFDADSLAELAASISEHGLIQPIVVRPRGNGFYEIIAGERRWRACKLAGLTEVPAVIRDTDDTSASLIAMVENLQREGLNPVEEANGYKTLMENFGLTQEETASRVGKSRSAVANSIRILALPPEILAFVREGTLSYGHARTLLPLIGSQFEGKLAEAVEKILAVGLSVRDTEKLVRSILENRGSVKPRSDSVKTNYYRHIESRVSSKLGRHAAIRERADGHGHIELAYSSPKDLEVLLKALCGKTFFDETD